MFKSKIMLPWLSVYALREHICRTLRLFVEENYFY